MSSLILSLFHRLSSQLQTLYDIIRMETITDPSNQEIEPTNVGESLDFVKNCVINKWKGINDLMLMLCLKLQLF